MTTQTKIDAIRTECITGGADKSLHTLTKYTNLKTAWIQL